MSESDQPCEGQAAGNAAPSQALAGARWLRTRSLLVVAVLVVAVLTLISVPLHINQDTWLALVAGRFIAAHGVPAHDPFIVLAHGTRWVDQQWLVQLLMYEVVRIGGLGLLAVATVACTGAVFGAVVAIARALGGEDLHVLMVLPPGALFFLLAAVSVRGQDFAYPLFVLTLWLLARELPRLRRPARRPPPAWQIYWVLPVLVLWGNLHGSVTLGAGIVMLYALCELLGCVRAGRLRGLAGRRGLRAISLLVLAPATLLANPYGTGIIHYYRATIFNSWFAQLVTEWEPTYRYPLVAVPLAIVLVLCLVVLWRSRGRVPLFDVLALTVLAAMAVDAVRNVAWFGLAAMMLMPGAISAMAPQRSAPLRRSTLNLGLAILMALATVVTVVIVGTRPDAWFERTYPAGATTLVSRLAAEDPQAGVFADVRYADWLVWHDPALAGRIAYDTSLELLTEPELSAVAQSNGTPLAAARELIERYRIWVLNPGNHLADRRLLAIPGVRLARRDKRVIIATFRSPASH